MSKQTDLLNLTDAITVDGSNVGIGTTDNANARYAATSGGGTVIQASSFSVFSRETTASNQAVMTINNTGVDSIFTEYLKDGSTVGSIGILPGDPYIYIGSGDTGFGFLPHVNAITPHNVSANTGSDNAIDLGYSTRRWDDIYATNGTIQTSDRNEKQDIEALSDAEQRVAVACKGLLRKFRWIDAVAEKGDDARIHFGIIAQDLQDAFAAEGLDAGRYAMFISSTWWEATETYTDDDGVEQTRVNTYETAEEAPEGATERTRLGVRYPELLAFIIGAT